MWELHCYIRYFCVRITLLHQVFLSCFWFVWLTFHTSSLSVIITFLMFWLVNFWISHYYFFTWSSTILWNYYSMLTTPQNFQSRRGALDTTLCDKVCQWLAAGLWFSPCSPVSFTNKPEILLKVALNTITLTPLKTDIWNLNRKWKTFVKILRINGVCKQQECIQGLVRN